MGDMHAKSNRFTKPVGPHYNVLTEKIAIDCEMMQSNIGQILGRVSIINYGGETIFDTQKCSRYRQYANRGANQGPSLKNLALGVLGRPIKQGRVSSVEDAIATMEVYRNAEADIEQEQGQ